MVLAGTAIAGFPGLYYFNYMLPAAGVRGAAIFRTAGRYGERLVSHDATFKVLAHLRVLLLVKYCPFRRVVSVVFVKGVTQSSGR